MFKASSLLSYLSSNRELPHISKYHREGYSEHCMLVIYEMDRRTKINELLLAAALHDVAKVRTQDYNKIGDPCFYSHEQITDDELSAFLTKDDPRYDYVKALIWCHMAPYNCAHAKDFDKSFRKACRSILKECGLADKIQVDDDFVADVLLLHEADDAGTVRSDNDLPNIAEKIGHARSVLATLH